VLPLAQLLPAMNTAFGFAEPLVTDTPLPFPEQCARIHDRIDAFLHEEQVSDRTRSVQEQTRISLGVIEKALDRYRWVAMRGIIYTWTDC
jgi:FAD synthetase